MAALAEEDLCLVANEEESQGKEIVSVSDKGGFGSRHIGVLKPLPLLSPVKQVQLHVHVSMFCLA